MTYLKKKRIDFKLKGTQYERDISKPIGLWWCNDAKALFRNSGSGNRRVDEVYGGDIAPCSDIAKPWNLCIEVKKSEGFSLDGFVKGNAAEPLLNHMLQCLSASQVGCNKIPLLICTKNYHKPLCFLYAGAKVKRKGKPFIARLRWTWAIPEKLQKKYPWDGGEVDFFCLQLEDFFASFTREDFQR